MMLWRELLEVLGVVALALPALALVLLSGAMLLSNATHERRVHALLAGTSVAGVLLTFASVAVMIAGQITRHTVALGPLIAVGEYHLELALLIDPLAMAMQGLGFALCGLIGHFSARYLHRDEGHHRFYLMLLTLLLGVQLVAVGAGFDLIFVGWELLGLSSALLIAFFYRRRGPLESAMRAYTIYRVSDIGLLSAIVLLHHALGGVEVVTTMRMVGALPERVALLIGALFVLGAMGKGAIAPFTGWLPRAMEGPTASSAIFYGALSVHASPFLLLRLAPLWEAHFALRLLIGALGALTACHASMVGRAQTDVKSALAYASAAQVGLIWVWIALGWHNLALLHLVGHAIGRAWQLLRAPSFIQERRALELGLGERLRHADHLEARLPARLQRALYHAAIERWWFDEGLDRIALTLRRGLLAINALDERVMLALCGPDDPTPSALALPPSEIDARPLEPSPSAPQPLVAIDAARPETTRSHPTHHPATTPQEAR